jgi:hypothetical protein
LMTAEQRTQWEEFQAKQKMLQCVPLVL